MGSQNLLQPNFQTSGYTSVTHAWPLIDWLFLAVTGFIVWHAVRFRDESGSPDMVRLLFGCIAAVFFFKVLFEDVLRVARF